MSLKSKVLLITAVVLWDLFGRVMMADASDARDYTIVHAKKHLGSIASGYVAISIGKGLIGTTDYPRGKFGVVSAEQLFHEWGYRRAWWSPIINDVVLWRPKS